MNRHDRRRAEARVRKAKRGYQHRLVCAHAQLPELRGRVVRSVIEHDHSCGIYSSAKTCSCVPNISLVPTDGGCVWIVDEHGRAHRQERQ